MAISVGSAFVLGMIFMLLMRCCAGVIVFFSLIGIFVLIAGGSAWLFLKGRCWYVKLDEGQVCNYVLTNSTYTVDDTKNFKYLTIGSYVLWGIAGAYLILLLCLCNRIRLGVAIAKTTSRFI
jgi:hypothetical protein